MWHPRLLGSSPQRLAHQRQSLENSPHAPPPPPLCPTVALPCASARPELSNTQHACHVRVQAAIEKERVLGKVMERPGGAPDEAQFGEIAKQRDIPEWSVPHYLTDLYQLSLSSDPNTLMLSSFTDRITELVAQVRLPADASRGGFRWTHTSLLACDPQHAPEGWCTLSCVR